MPPTRRAVLAGSLAAAAGCGSRLRRSPGVGCPTDGTADARLGFVGDLMLGRGVDDAHADRSPESVWGGTVGRLRALDGLFLNLECCLSGRGDPRPGRTYHFRADPAWAVPALGAVGTTFASLANNHVLDFGPDALADTTDHLSAAGIAHAGAGADLAAALRPARAAVGGLDVAVVALTDRAPAYAAGPDRPGTAHAPLVERDPRTLVLAREALRRARRADPDLVVASLHWGPNWEVRPSPRQRAFARWLVDRGVDLVHGHSAHVVQGVEVYRGRPVIYDAGDFVDDYVVKPDLHNDRSFLFELAVSDGRFEALRLVPVEIADGTVHRAGGAAAAWLRDRMRSLSAAFDTSVTREGASLVVPLPGCDRG